MRKHQVERGIFRRDRSSSTALAMGRVDRMNLVDIQRCRWAIELDVSNGAMSRKTANKLWRRLGERVREIKGGSAH